jgi:hypothetical protein
VHVNVDTIFGGSSTVHFLYFFIIAVNVLSYV